ncbi:zinc-dependent metalloprotease [Propionibacteriaceae bacterium Y1685]
MSQVPPYGPDDPQDPSNEPGDDSGASSSQQGGSGQSGSGQGGSGQSGSGGNPFEELMAQFGGLGGTPGQDGQPGAGGDPQDLGELMKQVQEMLAKMGLDPQGGSTPGAGLGGLGAMFGAQPGSAPEGGVNWTLAKDTARKTSAALGPDPSPTAAQREAVREAVTIAEVWLDDATTFPRAPGQPQAWARAEWIENTLEVWKRLVTPVASRIADAMENSLAQRGDDESAPPGLEQMIGPMIRSTGASMFGVQLGQALAQLGNEVVGTTDIALPLSDTVALLPANVAKFGDGLDQSATDVTLYLALRECARQRLFAGTNWLSSTLLTLVEEYASGISIDTSALEEALENADPANLEELNENLSGGLFEPQRTPEQQAVLARLETMLALVEGWVDEVVARATARWMPAAMPLAETMRRHRAAGGPAEATFASLVGLELRPRRLRDAANLWAALREDRDIEGRDAVWRHPDVMPSADDLDDPIGFVRRGSEEPSASDTDFDAELAKLLDEGATGGRDDDNRNDTGDDGPSHP